MTEPITPTPVVASPVTEPTSAPVVVQSAADVPPAEQPDESDAPADTSPEPVAPALPTNPETARLIEKNRAANREAAALRQRAKDLEKRLAVYDAQEAAKKRKELGESEALRQELAEAKAKLDRLAAETERMRREAAAVRDFHVLPDYAGYVATEMANAGEVDIEEWMSGFRAKHQAFFVPEIVPTTQPKPGNGATPPKESTPKPAPVKTADGGPPPAMSANKDVEIAQLKAEYKVLSTGTKMFEDGAGSRRAAIKRRLTELGVR